MGTFVDVDTGKKLWIIIDLEVDGRWARAILSQESNDIGIASSIAGSFQHGWPCNYVFRSATSSFPLDENDDPFLSVDELLGDAGEVQDPQPMAPSVDFGSERADGAVERIYPNDRDGRSTSRPKSNGDEHEEVTDPSSFYPCGDSSVSDG